MSARRSARGYEAGDLPAGGGRTGSFRELTFLFDGLIQDLNAITDSVRRLG